MAIVSTVFNLSTAVMYMHAHRGDILCLRWNASGTEALSGGRDGSVKAWNMCAYVHARDVPVAGQSSTCHHKGGVQHIAIIPDAYVADTDAVCEGSPVRLCTLACMSSY